MLIPPPPQSGEPAAERPKGKLPWSKPTVRVIQVNFTDGGFAANPNSIEGRGPPVSPFPSTGATYRTS